MALEFTPVSDPQLIIDRAIEGLEMRGVSMPGPNGPVMGYQWRLKVRMFGTHPVPDHIEDTPWVFGSEEAVDQMLQAWQEFLTTQGHWRKGRPPAMPPG
jgi:hypothetical protein